MRVIRRRSLLVGRLPVGIATFVAARSRSRCGWGRCVGAHRARSNAEGSDRDPYSETSSEHSALLPRGEVARWNDRAPAARSSRYRPACSCPGRFAAARPRSATLADRRISPFHPPDARAVPNAHGQPPLRDGARARLSRRPRSFPPSHRPASTAARRRSLFATLHVNGGTRTNRLGALRSASDRSRAPAAYGVRGSSGLVAADLFTLLSRCAHGELLARPRRGIRGVAGIATCAALRFYVEQSVM